MTQTNAAEHTFRGLDGQSARYDAVERTGDNVTLHGLIRESRTREGHVAFRGQPCVQSSIVRPLEAEATTRTTRFGNARIADEQEFRVEPEVHRATVD